MGKKSTRKKKNKKEEAIGQQQEEGDFLYTVLRVFNADKHHEILEIKLNC
jgi:hypothetical protein